MTSDLVRAAVALTKAQLKKAGLQFHRGKPWLGPRYETITVLYNPGTPYVTVIMGDEDATIIWQEGGERSFNYADPAFPDNLVSLIVAGGSDVMIREGQR